MRARRVVVTGAAGLIGSRVVQGLDTRWEIVGLDSRRGQGIRRLDLRRPKKVRAAFAGADAVIDLAGDPSPRASWEVVTHNNVPLALTTLEAAKECGVPRVVYASSNHVTGGYEADEPYASVLAGSYDGLNPSDLRLITAADAIRPDSPYAVGKATAETAGRFYAEKHGLSVICLRIGNVNRADRPLDLRQFAVHLSTGDLLRLVVASVEAPAELGFGVYYGVSANTWRIWDLSAARAELGYEPADDAEAWRGRQDLHA